jgi:hypothetical protein
VRIIQSAVGGGFGGKSCDDNNALVAAVLAKKARKPVKLINTREEEFLAGCRPRVFMKINVKMGFKKDGPHSRQGYKSHRRQRRLLGQAPAITGVAAMRHDTCYKYSDVRIDAKLIYTNKIPTGAFRGFGNPSAEWAVEQAIDLGRLTRSASTHWNSPASTPPKSANVSPHGNRVHQLRAEAVPRHDRKDDRLENQARQQATQYRFGSSLHGSRQRQAPLCDYDGSSATIKINEGRQGVNTQRRGRVRPRRAHGDVPDRRRGAWRAGGRRGNFPRRHRPHDVLFRRFRQPALPT